MCHNYAKHFSLLLFTIFIGSFSFAQNSNKENSIYSRYGIGELRNSLNTPIKAMGGISTAYADEYAVNSDNPASYATLRFTTYELGGEASMRTVLTDTKKYGTGMGALSYLTVGIPLGKYAGMAFGVKPNSRVYYQTQDSVNQLPGFGPALRTYSGDGSVNYAYAGFAGKYAGISFGFNLGYMFGTIRNSNLLSSQYDTLYVQNADFSHYTKVGGVYYSLGAMYDAKLKEKLFLRTGATVTLKQRLTIHEDDYKLSWRTLDDGSSIYDTVVNITNQRGNMTLPMNYSFGAHIMDNEKWMAGFDVRGAKWSDYNVNGLKDSVADQTYRVAIGGSYTPNARSLYKYLNRITYRLGFYYGTDYIKLRSTTMNYYGFSLGASLPFKRTYDRIHLTYEMGRRGTLNNGLIQENFYKFSFGISLNDKWFVKRKYD